MTRMIEVQLHQQLYGGEARSFSIRKITGAISADLNGRRFYVGDSLNEKQADDLSRVRNVKVSVMADK